MYYQVKAYVENHHMLEQLDKVIVGVSGGADSICLLFMLLKMKEEIGFSLMAVHIHHGLRGEGADRDAEYVQQLCAQYNVELKVYYEDVGKYAKAQGLSTEEAARDIRRERFLQTLEECGGTKIALAHHQNDNAETLLFNLSRGTGLKGLGGMRPKRGVFIRPLLCLKREDVESYLKDLGISYCTDETNLEDDYVRNRIRNHVIPYLEKEVNAQSVVHMTQTMEQMQKLWGYVREQADYWKKRSIKSGEGGTVFLSKERYEEIPIAIREYVVHDIICTVTSKEKDVETVHLTMVDELMSRQVGKEVHLPYHLVAKRTYEGILLFCGAGDNAARESSGEVCDAQMICKIVDKVADMTVFTEIPYTKRFDYDIIENTVKLRHRKPGDYISIDDKGKKQKLKQYFIDRKIPREERDRIWLVADGKHIMWIVGYRQNQMYQVSEHTKKILQIKIETNGGENNGRDCEDHVVRAGGSGADRGVRKTD